MDQAKLFIMDEMSMIGRQMLGKIEFKVRDTLPSAAGKVGEDATLAGRDAVLAGDPKQASPIGDESMFREGDYAGKGQNKPRGSDQTPSDAWTTRKLVRMGMSVRNSFEDVVLLRQVHRHVDDNEDLPAERREDYRRDATRFLDVTRGMADCTWTQADHAWLSRRNRSALQQTREGRDDLREFDAAPLLMDGRKDQVTGAVGAIKVNQLRLEQLSAETGKPIVPMRAYHDKPKTAEGQKMKPQEMDSDDFRGIENELLLCEAARVLLTQNLWVEAGLMNGALGFVRGYMWPEGGDPHSEKMELRTPLCVFVEFDSVNLGVDEEGKPRTFFPDDPSRRNWVPIFRQRVSSTVEEHVWRENYPLTLAWALTHWKAQGMTLDKVRVHLSERTAGIPGIGFVACTRVRHPWDLVFEEDLPEYEHFMKARRTPAFRERRRFELRQEARASRTLRRYGYCEADLWTAEERTAADELLRGLKVLAAEQRERLRNNGKSVDSDTYLWGGAEPDYEGELAAEVVRLAAGDGARKKVLERVAERLLDRVRVRVATADECALASELLTGVDVGGGGATEEVWRLVLAQRADAIAAGDAERLRRLREVMDIVARRLAGRGCWDEFVEDAVPVAIQPLHMSAVREALGALIPDRLHKSLDKAVSRTKDYFGAQRGGSVLSMDGWRVSVRAEDALARGRLQEDALEFFLLALGRICRILKLPVAIGSKTVGKEVGRQESPATLARVMEKWRKVWARDEVREQPELVIPVAVDDRGVAQDWVCAVVRSCVAGERLGDAKRLCVRVGDAAQRASTARRVARNVDVLVRGVGARVDAAEPLVEFVDVPECRVGSQRILCAFGLLLGRVAAAGQETALDAKSASFVPDVAQALRALFAYFRKELGERGLRDVTGLLGQPEECRAVLRMFGTVPSLVPRSEPERRVGDAGGASASRAGPASGVEDRRGEMRIARVATWNIAGGHRSAQAPEAFSAEDQRAAVMGEILRWSRSFACDVVALQECESVGAYEELLGSYELVGSARSVATRGYVHLYMRRGVKCERLELDGSDPCVASRFDLGSGGAPAHTLVVAAVHLPVGDRAGTRQRILERVVAKAGGCGEKVLLVGDMNAKDDEIAPLCREMRLQEAAYSGASWGVKGNAFYKDSAYTGPGLRKDRVLFGRKLWAEAHVVGQGKLFFDGSEFCLSDHFGVMAYVDVADLYASRAKQDGVAARVRRGQLVSLREQAQQKELVEARARSQAGREEQALARRRVAERDRADFQRAMQRGARQRRERRAALRTAAFGAEGLFADGVNATPALAALVPRAPTEVTIPALDEVPRGSWSTTGDVPLRGLSNRLRFACYVNSVAQVLMRTPALLEWMMWHSAEGCPSEETSCVLCALFRTYCQVVGGLGGGSASVPVFVARRGHVGEVFEGTLQHDVFEFLEHFLERARSAEIASGRYGLWGAVQLTWPAATHVERIFGFVRETRRRCLRCRGAVRAWFSSERVLRVLPREVPGGPLTVAEMYFDSCARVEEKLFCEGSCGESTPHECQSRVLTAPNVLVVQVRRGEGVRHSVGVEEQLEVPGFPEMALVGVVYHSGRTTASGHYTCLCRGPGGRFWFYDDGKPVCRMDKEVAHIKPKEVYMLVYCRKDGSATWQRGADESRAVDLNVGGGSGGGYDGCGNGGGGSGAGGGGGAVSSSGDVAGGVRTTGETPSKRRLSRKSSATGSEPRPASPVARDAATPERQAKERRLRDRSSAVGIEEVPLSPVAEKGGWSPALGASGSLATARRLWRTESGEAGDLVGRSVAEGAGAMGGCADSRATPRRLQRKTSIGAGSPCLGVTGGVGGGGVGGGDGAASSNLGVEGGVRTNGDTPGKRRLSRSSSTTGAEMQAASPVTRDARTSERQAKERRLGDRSSADGCADLLLSPVSVRGVGSLAQGVAGSLAATRRLQRSVSIGAAVLVGKPVAEGSGSTGGVADARATPRRLQRKTSAETGGSVVPEAGALDGSACGSSGGASGGVDASGDVVGGAPRVGLGSAKGAGRPGGRGRGRGHVSGGGRGGAGAVSAADAAGPAVELRRSGRLAARVAGLRGGRG